MPYYLAPYRGAGTREDPFRPRGSDQPGWMAIDLRPDPSRLDGGGLNACILYLPGHDPSPFLTKLADHREDKAGPRTLERLRNRLDLPDLNEARFDILVARLLLRPRPNAWKRLHAQQNGLYEIWLDDLLIDLPVPTGMATDNFNRANETPLASPWTNSDGANYNLSSNAVTGAGGDGDRLWYRSGAASSADQYAQATQVAGPTSDDWGPAVRVGSNGTKSGYIHNVYVNEERLFKFVNGAFTIILSHNVDAANGDVVRVEAEGSTIRAKINGSQVTGSPVTDTSLTTAGNGVGLYSWGSGGTLDDWEGGDLVTSTPKAGTDTGSGTEITGGRGIFVPDTGAGADVSSLLTPNTKAGVDSGSGSDVGSLVTPQAKAGTDSAVGTDVSNVSIPAVVIFPEIDVQVAFNEDPGDSINWAAAATLANRCEDLRLVRGRNVELAEVETGTCDLSLRNQDRHLDPGYTLGPYYGDLVPVKQARVRATVQSITYELFRGDTFDWEQQWQGRENIVPLRLLDAFDALSSSEDGLTVDAPSEFTGARINRILDTVGWPAAQRSIDAGQTLLQVHNYEAENTLQALHDVALWEQGIIFVNSSGLIVFHDRHRRMKPPHTASQVTLSNVPTGGELPLSQAKVRYASERLKNRVHLIQKDGVEIIEEDTVLQGRFRKRTLKEEVEIFDANVVQDMADYLLERLKSPLQRVDEVTIEPQLHDNLWQHALGRELGDRVTIKIRPPGTPTETETHVCLIEKISHEVTRGRWVTKWRTSPADVNQYWILGTSLLGVDTKLAV